ncbi:MAG: SIS domain-containing protein, partial [Bryobacteraceae bacterium]
MTASRSDFSALLAAAEHDERGGFEHTIQEICQQPPTWVETANDLTALEPIFRESLYSCERLVLTGSGSSQYAGECAAPDLQRELRIPVGVSSGGDILVNACASASAQATLVVSLARSGDSPESAAAVESLLATEPHTRHLIITCNPAGRLARCFADNPRVRVVALGDRVNDRSLVMTGSFTNLALSAGYLGWIDKGSEFLSRASRLCDAGQRLLLEWPDQLAAFVSGDIQRIVFLGHGCRFGAAREAALKMLEMTAGKVVTMAETYLGLRHGPMSFLNDKTLLVCFLSSDPLTRCYERDLILELDAKKLGARKLIAGVENPGAGLC